MSYHDCFEFREDTTLVIEFQDKYGIIAIDVKYEVYAAKFIEYLKGKGITNIVVHDKDKYKNERNAWEMDFEGYASVLLHDNEAEMESWEQHISIAKEVIDIFTNGKGSNSRWCKEVLYI